MEHVTREAFDDQRHEFDACIRQTPEIDPFCSSSYWVLPAYDALFSDHQFNVFRAERSDGWVALAAGKQPSLGRYLQPLEASWGLAGPLIGSDVEALVGEFAEHMDRHNDWDLIFLSGIFEESPQFLQTVRRFQDGYFVGVGPSMGRHIASLEGGFDGYMSRRTSKFRSNMRRARDQAADAGIGSEYLKEFGDRAAGRDVFERILAVESNSWKADDNSGILSPPMRTFYQQMVPMLAADDRLRVGFVTLDGEDIAYCFGGVFGDRYRGLQLSYHDDYSEYSAGNLAQLVVLEGLADESRDIDVYDMGQAMDYKQRWADDTRESVALVIRR
jgi:hypothetical protein